MISLTKNSKISLEKDGEGLKQICIGLNWGMIHKSSFFGLVKDSESVDLDGSVTMFNSYKDDIETVYYHQLTSRDGSIKHSGDDRSGDDISDEKDNEIISIDLTKVSKEVETIVFYLNSYKKQDFSIIPYSKIRIIEGTLIKIKSVFASFNLSSDPSFAGYTSMIMGKLVRNEGKWEFVAIGEPVSAKDISETIKTIKSSYL